VMLAGEMVASRCERGQVVAHRVRPAPVQPARNHARDLAGQQQGEQHPHRSRRWIFAAGVIAHGALRDPEQMCGLALRHAQSMQSATDVGRRPYLIWHHHHRQSLPKQATILPI
jgi:hypothetical protein